MVLMLLVLDVTEKGINDCAGDCKKLWDLILASVHSHIGFELRHIGSKCCPSLRYVTLF